MTQCVPILTMHVQYIETTYNCKARLLTHTQQGQVNALRCLARTYRQHTTSLSRERDGYTPLRSAFQTGLSLRATKMTPYCRKGIAI